jgi:hypothetical protein
MCRKRCSCGTLRLSAASVGMQAVQEWREGWVDALRLPAEDRSPARVATLTTTRFRRRDVRTRLDEASSFK